MDKTLKIIETSLKVAIAVRGNRIFIQGENGGVERAEGLIQEIREVNREGYILRPEDVIYAARAAA
ncbi:MAG: PhoH family protein, partial [Thermodesulfovibrionales bacterium]